MSKTSPSSMSMAARVLATSSESRLSASLGDLSGINEILIKREMILNDLAMVGLSFLDIEQQESIMLFLVSEEGLLERESVVSFEGVESSMLFFAIKEEESIMLVLMGKPELGELVELLDGDVEKEIGCPPPIRL